jgi:hypothetical protein
MPRPASAGALLECASCGLMFEEPWHLERHLAEQHAGGGA